MREEGNLGGLDMASQQAREMREFVATVKQEFVELGRLTEQSYKRALETKVAT